MPEEFIIWATRPSSVARETPVGLYLEKDGVKHFYCVPVDREKSDYIVEKKSFSRIFQRITRELVRDPKKYFLEYQKDKQILLRLARRVHNASQESDVNLWRAYDQYVKFLVDRYCRHFSTTFAIEDRIVSQLSKSFSQEEMEIITSPGKVLEYQKMLRDLIHKSISDVQKQYGWMNLYTFKESPYSKIYFKKLKKTVSQKEVDQMFLTVEKNRKSFLEIVQNTPDKKLQNNSLIAHECAFFKTDRMDQWKKSMLLVQKIFIRVAQKKKNWSIPLCTELTHDELRDALLLGIYPSQSLMRRRLNKQCITEVKNGILRVICDDSEIRSIKENIYHIDQAREGSISGVVASKQGIVRGKVKLVTDKSKIHRVSKGDILVAEWTTPEYLSAMKRARAIVTDEGGLTSHAAIVARELKKPCIIGTKVATKVFKDGDLIEMDTNTGIITILKKG